MSGLIKMADYIPWGRIIAAVLLIGIPAAICFALAAREMGDQDDSPGPRTFDFDDLV